MLAFVSAPIHTPTLAPFLPLARSLAINNIGAEGATALAAILKETKIEKLECATTLNPLPSVRFPVSAP